MGIMLCAKYPCCMTGCVGLMGVGLMGIAGAVCTGGRMALAGSMAIVGLKDINGVIGIDWAIIDGLIGIDAGLSGTAGVGIGCIMRTLCVAQALSCM